MKRVNKELIYILSAMIVCFVVHIAIIHQFTGWLSTDTDGYWLHAATFTGHDWSGVASKLTSYYGWGYSVLLTIPFMITSNFFAMYKIAVLINVLLCVLIVPMAYGIVKRVEPDINLTGKVLISLATSLYSTYIFESAVSLSETFLYFLNILIIFLLIKYCDTNRRVYGVLTSLAVGYSYCTHNRCIGIVVAFVILAFFICIKKRSLRELFVLLLPLAVMLGIKIGVNNWLDLREITTEQPMANTYAATTGGVREKMNFYGILSFLQCTLGEIWYTAIGTFMIAVFGIYEIVRRHIVKQSDGKYSFAYLFAIVSWFFSIGISALFCARGEAVLQGRSDIIYYGRYMETTVVFLFLMGLVYLWKELEKHKEKKSIAGLVFLIGIFLSLMVHHFVSSFIDTGVNFFSIVAVSSTMIYPKMSISILDSSLVALVVGAIVFYLFSTKNKVAKICALVFVMGMNIYIGYNASYGVSRVYEEQKSVVNHPTRNEYFNEVCNFVDENEIDTLYILTKEPYEAFSYQLVMNQISVFTLGTLNEYESCDEGSYVLVCREMLNEDMLQSLVYENDAYGLCIK